MAKLFLFICVLLIFGTVYANIDDEDVVDTEHINPLEVLKEAHDKERDERGIFDIFKKESPAAAAAPPPAPAGYGYKSSSSYSSSGGYGGGAGSYGSSSYGSNGGSYGSSYGSSGGSGGYGNLGGLSLSLGSGGKTGYGSSSSNYGYGSNAALTYGIPDQTSGGNSFKTSNSQQTLNFLMNARQQLPMYGSCPMYPLPNNVQHSCRNDQCEVSCPPMYSFPDGKTSLKMVCIGDQWIIRDSEHITVPPCQASCNPPCENNGICIEAGMCKCPDSFTGPLCQYKKSICATKVPVPKNSKITCLNSICNAECFRGFQFPDGSAITNIECQNDQWVHKKTGLTKPPDCRPICEPDCDNGGQCISFNVCQCPKNYRGSNCQHSIAACNVTKTNFNGNYKCSYDNELAKCTFSCPDIPGLKVDGRLDIDYKCKYEEGKFSPMPLPKCIYPAGYTIREGSKTSHYSQSQAYVMGGSGGTYGYEYMTEHEKILAIIARYKEYDQRSEWWSSEETVISPSSYSLYVTADVNVMIDRTPKAAFCTTWGGINMKTFDGLVFKAPLSCSHTLINDKQDATFDITLKGCPYGSGYGCAHSLKVYWQSVLYTFENQNGTIRLYTPLKNLPIPSQLMGMKVVPVAQHLQIDLESIGLKIDWDHHQYVGVHATPALWNRVGGLCGSLDGDYKNDLMTKTGKIVETVKSFTDAWRVDDDSELCIMENIAAIEFDSKNCDPDKRKKAIDICGRLLANEKLGDCIKSFNFEALIKTCVDDHCNCPNQAHPETCNCDAMAMLAKECAFKGIKLEHGWRNLEICPITCGFGRIYLPCGPDVEPTCESAVSPTKGKCNEGCFCPEGTVQYKDTCITPELCPCNMRDKEFKPETTIKKQCNTCTCKSGQWKCTDEQCGARCGAVGDPHYQTFDGKRFDFMGKCSYYLLKMSNMSVEAENIACSGAISENLNFAAADNPSCTKSVTVKFVQKNGVATSIKLDQGLVAQINGKEITKFPKVLGSGEVLIRRASSNFMTVEFPGGIRVWWDGVSRVYIDAPPSFRDQTAGLCGTFNSNTEDDFLTPEGDIETAIEPFADKWRTKDTCDFLAQTPINPHPCTAHPERRAEAEKYCDLLMGDIFQDCNWSVEYEQYHENCMYDVCACKEELSKCFCPIFSAYGTECMREGIKTGWRMSVKECAVKCPLGQIYDECGDSCALSCDDLPSKKTCTKECVEGCRCPHGEYLNEHDECVPQTKCHCSYDGMTFKPGYKEVRPGPKFLDICTCKNGLWECEEAEADDDKKYPPSSELRAECANRPYAEFTKCVPKEPKTCKNMHEYKEDLEECVPGCQCIEGYVYDTALKMCVLPEKCSCHHGGKSYNDGEEIKEECNTCVCQAGNWKCSSNGCESTCSVWGDSHFTTFDRHDFDFQGACDYVLSKGVASNGDGFTVTIQNVLCGTMGVTCSKSVEIALTGSVQDTLTLSGESSFLDDDKTVLNKIIDTVNSKSHGAFHVYKAGVFVVVEVLPLHLQIKWDEGTRVYVKLGNEWKKKVSGLCGNYNDNAMDDMQTPSNALETSALTFGHSWKVQKYCAMPTQPIDACKEHPERETWAQLKCGVLKSNLFKDCHAEVPLEKYLKRCIFDTCACDQGGDCECLCTAVSAYAHACSQKGINIRWRTPHFCPMQCDPHCSEYKSCTPACPVETCDNFLQQSGEHMCKQEQCIEGCLIKPCEEGMIYLNDTFKECVPKSECKPVCMVKDGVTYYEGDITYQDECSTCRCTKKKEVCSGVKCTAEELTTPKTGILDRAAPLKTQEQPKCIKGWTRWFDDDTNGSQNVTRLDDDESLPRYDRMESIYGTCAKEFMKKIECRVVNTHESYDLMPEKTRCSLDDGLACMGTCHDYEIRVFCECNVPEVTTPKPTLKPQIGVACDNVMAEYLEYPGDCYKFLHCQPKTDGSWHYVEKTCGPHMMFNPTSNICDHISAVQELKESCQIIQYISMTPECTENEVMSDCANQCERTCHYYGMVLRKRGLCQKGEHCKPGCVDAKRPDCPAGKFWRDETTCVEADECPCMDKTEKYVQPHMPFIGEWEICQCLDNAYTCLPNKIEQPVTKKIEEPLPQHGPAFVLPVTVSPPNKCNPDLMIPIIEGDEPLPDTVFNASSVLGPNYIPSKARLLDNIFVNSGAWSPMFNDQQQYLQITLPHSEPMYGIKVAGNPDFDNYVTLFKMFYSLDGHIYHELLDETEKPQMFNGPHDSRYPETTYFKIPIEAKSVKIYPLKWHGSSIAMRVELLGCDHDEMTTPSPITTPTTEHPIFNNAEIGCTDKMGVENGELSPSQVKASSVWQLPQPAKKPQLLDLLKLSSSQGWKPAINTANEYVEFDFLEPRNISGFITKGGPEGWVSGYKVMFSKNRLIWNKILFVDGQPKIFSANYDSDTENANYFKTPILTQYIKIVPSKWERNINMRIEPVGCFEKYPITKSNMAVVEAPKISKCLVCEGIVDTSSTDGNCKCKDGLFWDGSNCIQSNLCPCVENYVTYPIGSPFENKNCEECVCVLGGHSSCKPKKCGPCGPNLRPIVGDGCYCKCEPCPKHQKLCPSSGDCIPEALWCNGIKDCTDDEDSTCVDSIYLESKPIKSINETEIISCPTPECPPKMQMKVTAMKQRKMSSMFSSTFTKKVTVNRGEDGKVTKTKVITQSEEFLDRPQDELVNVQEEDCAEFTCVPIKEVIHNKNESFTCTDPKCPPNYVIELDMSSSKPGDCPRYTCLLKPSKDDVCEISGKTITTFDNTQFSQYLCSHILARDFVNSSWIISVHLQCKDDTRKVCRKTITITDLEKQATLTLMPKLRVNFNGFEYSVQQLINSPICKASFVVSQVGDTVLVVSPQRGFWVSYNDIGYIKIGISSKFIKTVDGLCGYYDGISSNDKRSPDGKQMASTSKFGESWFDNKTPKDKCKAVTCPKELTTPATTICNSISRLSPLCGKAVNFKEFRNKCFETTCDCLRDTNMDKAACKCKVWQDMVSQCLTVNPNVNLGPWRAKHNCEISCPAPLVHSDCYKRRCEPSCDSLNSDDCPIIPDACFAGCYCPEGMVRKGDTCVPISECKDCVCDTIGSTKYFTYDRNSFTFNGNCSYLLSRDIVLPGVHTFQVYVTMDDCHKLGKVSAPAHSSCTKSLHILNGDHLIHIQRSISNPKVLEVLVDGYPVKKMPYKDTWINLKDVPGKEIILSLTDAHVEVKASFDDLMFSIGVPSVKYGAKLEGLCGDCDGNANNDLQINPAKKKGRGPSNDLVAVINSWKAEEPKLGLKADVCLSEIEVQEECIPLPPETDPCMLLLDENIFGQCNMIVSPLPYVSTCQQDMCKPGNSQKGACDTMAAYAKECNKQGICLNWRGPNRCPYECPLNMMYEPCSCSKTCDSLEKLSEFQAVNINSNVMVNTVTSDDLCEPTERYEGCFCPPDKVLDNGKCISEEMCVKCEDPERMPSERWKKDKCTECVCDKNGKTQCSETNCLVEENICAEGFIQQKKVVPEDQCCPKYTCVQEPKLPPPKTCLAPLMPQCGPGQYKKTKTGPDGCNQIICECKPKEQCDPLKPPASLKPGEKLVKDDSGCCPTQKLVCDKSQCPEKPESCMDEFFEVFTKQEPKDCCPTYECAPPKDVCIVQDGANKKYIKKLSETWVHPAEPCKQLRCAYGPHDTTKLITTTETCDTKCGSGFEYVRKDQSKCCGDCVQTKCVLEGKLYEPNKQWKSADNCTTFACVKKGESLIVSSMKETCPDVSKCPKHLLVQQVNSCCKLCKEEPQMENMSNCLPVSLAETETSNLIKVLNPGHGYCLNIKPIKGFTECSGSCNSGSKYNRATFAQDKICQCCNIKSYKTISVELTCEDGTKLTKDLEIPAACGCQPCSDSHEYQSNDGIDIRVQPMPLAEMIRLKRR